MPPHIGQSYNSENARVQSKSQESMPVFGCTEAIPATMPFAPIPRSTLRYNELACRRDKIWLRGRAVVTHAVYV